MLEILQSKVEAIADKYAELVERRLVAALKESEIESTAMCEINDGIRVLNHMAATLERIVRIQRGNDSTF